MSHTNFDAGRFGAGAIGCATTLSAALAAGVLSLMNTKPADFTGWNMKQLIDGFVLSERRRGHELRRWQATVDELGETRQALADAQDTVRRQAREIALMRLAARR